MGDFWLNVVHVAEGNVDFPGFRRPRGQVSVHRNGVLTRQANVQSKSPLIAKFARAIVEAIHIYKTDRELTLKITVSTRRLSIPIPHIVIVAESGLLQDRE